MESSPDTPKRRSSTIAFNPLQQAKQRLSVVQVNETREQLNAPHDDDTLLFQSIDSHVKEPIQQDKSKVNFVERVLKEEAERKQAEEERRRLEEEKARMLKMKCSKVYAVDFFGGSYAPGSRQDYCLCPMDDDSNAFLLFGGLNVQKENELYRDVHRFDVKRKEWQLLDCDHTPHGRFCHVMFRRYHKLYVIGGRLTFRKNTAALFSFDMKSNVWSRVDYDVVKGEFPPVYNHAGVYYNSDFDKYLHSLESDDPIFKRKTLPIDGAFIYGGDIGQDTKDPTSDLWFLDFEEVKPTWSKLAHKFSDEHKLLHDFTSGIENPGKLCEHSCNLWRHFMIVFGGIDGEQKQSNRTWKYDLIKREWTLMKTELVAKYKPTPRSKHAAAISGDHLYIFGGGIPLFNSMFRLNLVTGHWGEIELFNEVPGPRYGCEIKFIDSWTVECPDPRYRDRDKFLLYGGSVFSDQIVTTNDMIYIQTEPIMKKKEKKVEVKIPQLSGRIWTSKERRALIEGIKKYGDDYEKISKEFVKTRNPAQTRNYACHPLFEEDLIHDTKAETIVHDHSEILSHIINDDLIENLFGEQGLDVDEVVHPKKSRKRRRNNIKSSGIKSSPLVQRRRK